MKYLLLFCLSFGASFSWAQTPASPKTKKTPKMASKQPMPIKRAQRDVARVCKSESVPNSMLMMGLIREGETNLYIDDWGCQIIEMQILEKANYFARVSMAFECLDLKSPSRDRVRKTKLVVADLCDGLKNMQIVERQVSN